MKLTATADGEMAIAERNKNENEEKRNETEMQNQKLFGKNEGYWGQIGDKLRRKWGTNIALSVSEKYISSKNKQIYHEQLSCSETSAGIWEGKCRYQDYFN